MEALEIHPLVDAREARFDSLVHLYYAYLDHFQVKYSPARIRSLLTDALGEVWFHCLTAHFGDTTVGFCVFTNSYSPIWCCFAYTLNDIYIRAGCRGHGYGSALIDAIVVYGAAAGVHKLSALVDPNDPRSARFYSRNGFGDGDTSIAIKV